MCDKIICNNCGKEIIPGNRPDGLPNGVGFQLSDGNVMNVCTDCLIEMGANTEDEDEE